MSDSPPRPESATSRPAAKWAPTPTGAPGSIDVASLDLQHNRHAMMAFGVLAIVILLLVSAINYWMESGELLRLTLGVAAAIVICLIILRRTGQLQPLYHLYGLIMLGMTFTLLYTGGIRGNGHLWIFLFPPVCFFLMGLAYGSAYFAGILLLSALILFGPFFVGTAYSYDTAFGMRFLIALCGVAGMSGWSEYFRGLTHRALVRSVLFSQEQAGQDDLTGWFNRRGGMAMIQHYRNVCRRNAEPFTFMMLDVDHFKQVNDTYGHAVGDEVLAGLTSELRKMMRSQDVCIRWGGEEFLLLLPQTTLENARVVAANLLAQLRVQVLATSAGPLSVTCSIGLAQCDQNELPGLTIDRADARLYQAKREGRDRYSG